MLYLEMAKSSAFKVGAEEFAMSTQSRTFIGGWLWLRRDAKILCRSSLSWCRVSNLAGEKPSISNGMKDVIYELSSFDERFI